MTSSLSARRTLFTGLAAPMLLAFALTGCAGGGQAASSTAASPSASSSATASPGPRAEGDIVVDFGTFDSPSIHACGPAGVALKTLKAAKIATEGSGDYGDAVV